MSIRNTTKLSLILILLATGAPVLAQREPVLKQIDLPHSYYYREMYLPQLTTGPSSAAWSPDSRSLVYSMAGTLWSQNLDSTEARQLTSGAGYDYQPDCSPDGRWVVYSSYAKDAVELWALNLDSKETKQLTSGSAVNVEPRFSPDGKRIAFVSTSYNGHFHIFAGDFSNGELKNVQRLTGETRSSLPRYYYSAFDHEISPAWSPDGAELMFISNRGHIHGTGGFWRMKAQPGADAREIRYEETNWKARPDFSPDGTRVVYASYLGQQWHQLWAMPSQGGDPFPLSYGDFDNTYPRWSPDGKKIAFISNRGGNVSLWTQEALGGAQSELVIEERHYLRPVGHITITVLDAAGHPTPARIFVTGEDARAYAPDDAPVHADDNFSRAERPFESHYFHTTGKSLVTVPAGQVEVEVMKGFEFHPERKTVQVGLGESANLVVRLRSLNIPVDKGKFDKDENVRWVSGDVHVHMNYGGSYRSWPKDVVAQAAAENLSIVESLIVNKEQRIPDIAYFRTTPDPASTSSNLLLFAQEYHTSYWGHLGLLNLTHNFLLPGYAVYPKTAASSLVPMNADIADLAHRQNALVGYVHPYDAVPDPAIDSSLTHELPVDVALGKVDYIEVVGFSDHRSTAEVWYHLLNCGFRLPTGAGTDAMTNYASLRGPVGLDRVYAAVPSGPLKIDPWLNALKRGKTFATNGPLLGFTLGARQIGDELQLPAGDNKVKFTAWMRSIVPIDHFEVICNGKVVRDLKLRGDRESGDSQANDSPEDDTIPISQSGWCVLRAWSEQGEHPVLDIYPYATTSPIYVKVAGSEPKPIADAAYFVTWINRIIQAAEATKSYNTPAEKAAVLKTLSDARAVYVRMQ